MAYLVTQSNNLRQSYQVTSTCPSPRICVKNGSNTSYIPLVPATSSMNTLVGRFGSFEANDSISSSRTSDGLFPLRSKTLLVIPENCNSISGTLELTGSKGNSGVATIEIEGASNSRISVTSSNLELNTSKSFTFSAKDHIGKKIIISVQGGGNSGSALYAYVKNCEVYMNVYTPYIPITVSSYRAALYSSNTSVMSTASSSKITGITYVTRASTSGTSYGTRLDTSVSYLTRASTSGTSYGTKVSTTNTSYGTKASTTNTIVNYTIAPNMLSSSYTSQSTMPARYLSQVMSTWDTAYKSTTYGASGYKGDPIYNSQTLSLYSNDAITMYPQLRLIVPKSSTKTTFYTSLVEYKLGSAIYTNKVQATEIGGYKTKQVTTTTHYDTKVVTTGTTYQTRVSTSSTKKVSGTKTITTGTTYLTRESTMNTLYGTASTASSTSLKVYSSYF